MRRMAALFLRDQRGVFMVIGAVFLPVIAVLSLAAVDYSNAHRLRNTVQQAADNAALAMAQAQVLRTGGVALNGNRFLTVNIPDIRGAEIAARRVRTVRRGHVIVEVDMTLNTLSSRLLPTGGYQFTIRAEARFDDPQDIDFAVLIDRSPSMLIGASPADMSAIGAINQTMGEGNCAFACHYSGRDSYTRTRGHSIDTRLDVAKRAVTRAFERAKENAEASGGDIYGHVFTFTRAFEAVDSGRVQEVLARRTIGAIEPDTELTLQGDRYAQSNIDSALGAASSAMSTIRSAHEDRRSFFMLITDGVEDYNIGGRRIEPMTSSVCEALKSNGVTVAVIYTTYFPLYSNGFYNSNVKPFEAQILPRLRECASVGWFFEAAYTEDIDRAIDMVLDMALPKPQLTF